MSSQTERLWAFGLGCQFESAQERRSPKNRRLKGWWKPVEASEERRLALLPKQPAPEWDALMVQQDYVHALSLVP